MKITQKRISKLLTRLSRISDKLIKFSTKEKALQILLIEANRFCLLGEKNLRNLKNKIYDKEHIQKAEEKE